MIRHRLMWGVPLAVVCMMASPSPVAAAPLHLPAAMLPAKLRALARAKLHSNERRYSWQSRFNLETGSGYQVTVVGVNDTIALEVRSQGKLRRASSFSSEFGQAVTAYVARGTVTPARIDADFPGFGEVHVRFRPSGRIARFQPRRCGKHAHLARRYGAFLGRIHFTGEAGYIKIHAHRAKGTILTPLRLHCQHRQRSQRRRGRHERQHRRGRRHPTHRHHRRHHRHRRSALAGHRVANLSHRPFMLLEAGSRRAVVATEVVAAQLGGQELFLAMAEQSLGRMAEVRYAFAVASSNAFRSNEALTSATVKPPAPFHGKGIYGADAQGDKSWTGSLSASFPGASGFPLTGTSFTVALRAAI